MPMPLYVDLDGTLIRGDTMRRAFFALLPRHTLVAIRALCLLPTRYRPAGKKLIGKYVPFDPAWLDYRADVLDYVRQAKAQGRRVVLASGTWQGYVDAVLQQLPGLFDAGYGTTDINLIGENKLKKIRQDSCGEPFEYLGDSFADLKIFPHAAVAGWAGDKPLGFVAPPGTRLHRFGADL